MLMFRGEIEDNRPLACLTQQVNSHKIMQHPTCRRLLNPFTFLVGKRGLMLCERVADMVFPGRLDQQPHRHHPHQRHEALGLVERAR